jgi:hypothetical protein
MATARFRLVMLWMFLVLLQLGCGNQPTATSDPISSPSNQPSLAKVDFEDGTDGVLNVDCGAGCDSHHDCVVKSDPARAHSGSGYGECFSDTAMAGDPRVMFRWRFCGTNILPDGPCQPATTGPWTHDFYIYLSQSVIDSIASQPCSDGQVKLWRSRTGIYGTPSNFNGWDIGIMGPEINCGNGDRVSLVCDSGICSGGARQVTTSLTGDTWHHVCIEYSRPAGRGSVFVYLDDQLAALITEDSYLGDDIEYQGGDIGADTLEVTNDVVFRMRVDDVRWRFGKQCT